MATTTRRPFLPRSPRRETIYWRRRAGEQRTGPQAAEQGGWGRSAGLPPLLPPFLPCLVSPGAGDPLCRHCGSWKPWTASQRSAAEEWPSVRGRGTGQPLGPSLSAPTAQGWSIRGDPGTADCGPAYRFSVAPHCPALAADTAARWPRVSASCCAPCSYCCGAA